MSVVGVGSAKGAPGVTTACLALTLAWPRSVLLVEADPAGGDLLAGLLAGAEPPGGGLLGLALAARRGRLGSADVLDRSIALDAGGDHRALVAPVDVGQSRPIRDAADRIAEAIASTAGHGLDVIVDLGRVGPSTGGPWSGRLARLLLVMQPTLRGASAARSTLAWLPGQLSEGCRLGVLLAGRGPYRASEIAGALGVDVVGPIDHDPASARVLAGEAPASRGFDRRPLMRSARTLAAALTCSSPSTVDEPVPAHRDQDSDPLSHTPAAVGRPA